MKRSITFTDAPETNLRLMIDAHIKSLSVPFEGYVENMLILSKKKTVYFDGALAGYTGITENFIDFFFISLPFYHLAPDTLTELMAEAGLSRVMVRTIDPMLVSLISEWEYTKDYYACMFIDGGRIDKPNVSVKDAHVSLARMYTEDERFKRYYDKDQSGIAAFLREAIIIYAADDHA